MGYYSRKELEQIGVKNFGVNVLISRKASLISPKTIEMGSNIRIDDFCILSGNIKLGNNIHIAPYCGLFGSSGIVMEDYSGLSSRVTVYSESDDYSGEFLTNPTIPNKYRNVKKKEIYIGKHAIVGASAVLLPGAYLGEGSAVGALSLVSKVCEPWYIYVGVPAKRVKQRLKNLLELEIAHKNES